MKNIKSFKMFEQSLYDDEVYDDEIYDEEEEYDIEEEFNGEGEDIDEEYVSYSEASEHMDKFMIDDVDLQDEFYELLDAKDVDDLKTFLENNIQDEERFESYLPDGGTIKGFAQWLVDNVSQ